ncbi:hypothetical protein HNR59_003601 [Aquamicrobium lusatiense]|uniref:Uncharacterized protein n=1 Tax=Aquamicrobium lusatiense TaxID=89772 RepID=A0A7W9VXI4_9HYPH|nr:hypothetical protein [Aquamicrobium lusatiense]MBB6014207.1 hypothetical protein [Aquamicrobium lusatiense]
MNLDFRVLQERLVVEKANFFDPSFHFHPDTLCDLRSQYICAEILESRREDGVREAMPSEAGRPLRRVLGHA